MSYELFTWRLPSESAYDCGCRSLLLEDTRKARSRITLVGKGEHEGTNLTFDKSDLLGREYSKSELAAYLDYRFLAAHADRLARQFYPEPVEEHGGNNV